MLVVVVGPSSTQASASPGMSSNRGGQYYRRLFRLLVVVACAGAVSGATVVVGVAVAVVVVLVVQNRGQIKTNLQGPQSQSQSRDKGHERYVTYIGPISAGDPPNAYCARCANLFVLRVEGRKYASLFLVLCNLTFNVI